MNNKFSHDYEVKITSGNIMIKKGHLTIHLPPAKKVNKKNPPRTDFYLFGKSIVDNLGFSELYDEVLKIKTENK